MQLDGSLEQLAASGNLAVKNGEIAAKSNDWQIGAVNLNLPLQINLGDHPTPNTARAALGSLSVERARFGGQRLAPLTTTISLANNTLRLHQPLRIALFGGEVELRNLSWPDIIRDPKAVTFSADTKRLQLQDLTEAFNWPRFSGQLNGSIPEVESAGNTLRTRGEIQAELFGGRVRLSKLEIENPFSALASIKLSAKLESIHSNSCPRPLHSAGSRASWKAPSTISSSPTASRRNCAPTCTRWNPRRRPAHQRRGAEQDYRAQLGPGSRRFVRRARRLIR